MFCFDSALPHKIPHRSAAKRGSNHERRFVSVNCLGQSLTPGFLAVVLSVLALLSCTRGSTSNSASALSRPPTERPPQAPAKPKVPPLICPALALPQPVTTPPAPGGHRVVLSWKASLPADSRHSDAVGYCIYRGVEGKKEPPVLLNVSPYPATACVDDSVENGRKYYYVVRAISIRGVTSSTSNRTRAAIPKKSPSALPPRPAPLCRGDK